MTQKLKWVLNHAEESFGALLMFVMSVFAFANVISRYVVNLSLNFTEELNVYFFVWLTFLGSAIAAGEGTHMSISMLYDRLPNAGRKILYIVNQSISALLFLALGCCGVREVLDEIALSATTETIVVPVWWFTASIPIGSLLMIFRIFLKTRRDLKSRKY